MVLFLTYGFILRARLEFMVGTSVMLFVGNYLDSLQYCFFFSLQDCLVFAVVFSLYMI